MATVNFSLNRVDGRATTGSTMPVTKSQHEAEEDIVSSGTSQQLSIAGTAPGQQFWTVEASGGAVWVKFGANPTAVAGEGWLVPDGGSRSFSVTEVDEIPAVIDA